MKATGIVRRLDDLGRVLIPKELRRTLRLSEGDPLEFFTEDGAIIMKRYSPLRINEDAQQCAAKTLADFGITSFALYDTTSKLIGSSDFPRSTPDLLRALTETEEESKFYAPRSIEGVQTCFVPIMVAKERIGYLCINASYIGEIPDFRSGVVQAVGTMIEHLCSFE